MRFKVLIEAVEAERDKNSPQNIKGKLGDGLFPSTMPDEVRNIIKKWKVVSKSPYSYSFYDITNKSWGEDPDNFLRVADHWNFNTSIDDGRVHAKTDKPVINNKQWALGRYDATTETYHIIQIWDYEADPNNDRLNQQLREIEKARVRNAKAMIASVKDLPSKRVLAAMVSMPKMVAIKSDLVDRKDPSAAKALERLCNAGIISSVYTSWVNEDPSRTDSDYPLHVLSYARNHKRSDKIYWVDKLLQPTLVRVVKDVV